jgi:hypothetical protein
MDDRPELTRHWKATLNLPQEKPMVIKHKALDIQICVPADWTDEQAEEFANREVECGTQHGWQIRHTGDTWLQGDPERVPCAERTGYVHIMLDA